MAIILGDANNFYFSCERVFRPDLEGKPVLVLSNNDGCAVARSNEVKALGIKMGAPLHQIRPLVQQHNIQVFSSNYTLYGDLSNRVMLTLQEFSPDVEVYSIDEAFLKLTDRPDLEERLHTIRQTVRQWTGIPLSLGAGPTKTLAKIANEYAKQHPETGGVCLLNDPEQQRSLLSETEVSEVWGIGRQWTKLLNQQGITTALQLRDANEWWVKQEMGVVGMRTVLELRGMPCLSLELCPQPRQSRMVSRSFGRPVELLEELKEATLAVTPKAHAHYTGRAAVKLRRDELNAQALMVFIQTNRFASREPQYENALTLELPVPTNDTGELTHYALRGLERIYRTGYCYKKAGVLVSGLVPAAQVQQGLFDDPTRRERSRQLMGVLDALNKKYGTGTVRYGVEGFKQDWQMKAGRRSPRYTTNWKELLEVR